MSDSEIEELARRITEMLREQGHFTGDSHPPPIDGLCHLSASEQEAVRDILKTKKHAVKAFLVLIGALCLWILKDAYVWIVGHLAFK